MPSISVDLPLAMKQVNLEERLRRVPASAMNRGVFFNVVDHELRRRGLVLPPSVRPSGGWRSYALYPTASLLRCYATAGALLASDPLEGVRQLFRGQAEYFASTWFGRAFQRFIKPDPFEALSWIERSREHIANYGNWRLEGRGPGKAVMHMFDEYVWIEAAQKGGCEGLLATCGVDGDVTVELDSAFAGRVNIRWSLRS